MSSAVQEPQAPEASPDPAAEQPAQPEGLACANCGAALADGQDWCLECGTAVRQGRSPLPGWRTGAATIVATVVLASGAVAAAYAAIRSDDGTTSSGTQLASVLSPGQTGAGDGVPQPDPIDIPSEQEVPPLAGATPTPTPDASAEVPPAVAPPAPAAPVYTPPAPVYTPPAPVYTPPATGTDTPATGTDNNTDGNTSGSSTGDDAKPVARAELVEVPLVAGTTVVAAYNPPAPAATPTTPTDPTQTTPTTPTTPADPTQTTTTPATPPVSNGKVHADTDFTGDPKAAFDGNDTTAWSVALPTPELVADPQVGLLIDLGSATKLRRLVVTPTTPGTTIEVYGSDADVAPATLDDKGWTKLATQLDVAGKTKITLGKDAVGTGKVRQLLIYFSAGPDDGTSTSVGVSELELYR